MTTIETEIDEPIIGQLTKDLKAAAVTMTGVEARYLVDARYQAQDNRMRAAGQIRAQKDEPHAVLQWVMDKAQALENQIGLALKYWAESNEICCWTMQIKGVGPIMAAGLVAHLRCSPPPPTVGHYWRYAGLDPSVEWVSKADAAKWLKENCEGINEAAVRQAALHFGRKYESLLRFATTSMEGKPIRLTLDSLSKSIARRPHNAGLKTLCWKLGESFVKVKGSPESVYGAHYAREKARYQEINARLGYKEAAAEGAARVGHATEAYKHYRVDQLPPGHIHARAKRAAVKLFLSHFHHMVYRLYYKTDPPKPFAIAMQGHAHYIEPEIPFPV